MCLCGFSCSSALEELNVRSNLALSQKRFVNELEGDAEELEQEFLKMTAQVVSRKETAQGYLFFRHVH